MIQINPTSNQPMFEQIISQIKMAVLKGYLKPGDFAAFCDAGNSGEGVQ